MNARNLALKLLRKAQERAGKARSRRFEPFIAVLKGEFCSPNEERVALSVCGHFLRSWPSLFVKEAELLAKALEEAGVREEDAEKASFHEVFEYYGLPLGDFIKVAYEFCGVKEGASLDGSQGLEG